MNKFYLALLILIFVFDLQAQTTFQKTYNLQSNAILSGLVVTQSNGYAMCGVIDFQSWFLRTDPLGQVVASKKLETTDTYGIRSMEKCTDGGFILSADGRAGPQRFNMNLTKIDSMGNILWTKSFGGADDEKAMMAKQVSDGGFIACGTTVQQGSRTFVVKTDGSGNFLWSKTFADTIISFSTNYPRDIIETADNGFLICGSLNMGSSDYDSYLIKTNSTGDLAWSKTYMNPEWNSFEQIQTSSDGNYVICGWVDGIANSQDDRDMSLVKVDQTGSVLWTKVYENPGIDLGFHMDRTSDNGFILCGITEANNSASNCVILKTDSVGKLEWSKGFPLYLPFTEGNIVRRAADNGYIIGSINGANTPFKVFLAKTDQAGEGNNCFQSSPSFTESSISFSHLSPFIEGRNDTVVSFSLITTTLTHSTNTICFTDDISELTERTPLNLYPNPAQSTVTIDLRPDTKFRVMDAIGSFVSVEYKFYNGQLDLDVSPLASGMYFVISEDGYAKFIKE